MGPKPKPKQPASKGEEKEDVFQAVLLADDFNSSMFGPVWAEKRYPDRNPFGDDQDEEEDDEDGEDLDKGLEEGGGDGDKIAAEGEEVQKIDYKYSQECLMPLVNRKLLDYSLEALTVSGVQEIFIYCSSGAKGSHAVRDYIKKSRWTDLMVKIHVISSKDCESLGDALRDLDAKGMIRNDFILMASGVVTNIPLRPLLDEHRKTMKSDKGAVMTLVHRKIPRGHRSRSQNENQAIVTDAETGKILAFSHKLQANGVLIPIESLKREMNVVFDTVDTGVVICSSSILPLFTDNFDFTNIPDFIKNLLMNEEVMGNTIYLRQLRKGYATRIVDLDTLLGVSLDIIQRWSYPLVPDMPFGSGYGDRGLKMGVDFVYKVPNVRAARDSVIGSSTVIGSETTIETKAVIRQSCIGRKCAVGKGSHVINSQLGDNVTIGDGCKIQESIILDGTRIDSKMNVPPRSLVLGSQIFPIQSPATYARSSISSDDPISPVNSDDEEEHGDHRRFYAEVLESLHRGYTDKVAVENLFVEIQGSRTANFMYFEDAIGAVVKGIFGLAQRVHRDFDSNSSTEQWEKTRQFAEFFLQLIKLYVKDEATQGLCLKFIEEYGHDNVYFRPMTIRILKYYYDEDVLSEEAIIKWHTTESLYAAGGEIRRSVQKLIDWLEASSEEDSESD